VVNLSDSAIDFYYNDLNYINTHLDKDEEEIVYKTPITEDYPGFFAIDRGNNELEIYTKHYIDEVKMEYYYIVLIYNEKVEIYRTSDINENYKELNENRKNTHFWRKVETNGTTIVVEVQNMTGVPITIISNGYAFGTHKQTEILGDGTIGQYHSIDLENNAKCVYAIDDEIFSLKYIYFNILYPQIFDNEEHTLWHRHKENISINNKKHKNIIIILKGYNNGYAISYR
jgi:hypothetical protein